MLSFFELLTCLITLTAAFAWINYKFFKLPDNIGLLVIGLVASIILILIDLLLSDKSFYSTLSRNIKQIDFYDAVMHGILGVLLFAGALHVDFARLRSRSAVVGALATLGVMLSTLIIAGGLWLGLYVLGAPIDFSWALVFGAIIAPTDPVAVLSTLKSLDVPEQLKTDMTGEALFSVHHPGPRPLVELGRSKNRSY